VAGVEGQQQLSGGNGLLKSGALCRPHIISESPLQCPTFMPPRESVWACQVAPRIPHSVCRRLTGLMECDGSFGLDTDPSDNLAPLFGFISDELAEVGGRAREYGAAKVGNEPCPECRVSETRIYRAI